MENKKMLDKYIDRVEKYNVINNENELMDFLDNFIQFGWVDINRNLHVDTLENITTLYKTNSLVTTMQSGLATCLEEANLIKQFFENLDYETHLYCSRLYDDNKQLFNCFIIYKENNNYVYFEHLNKNIKGIRKYKTLEEALEYASINTEDYKNRKVTEIDYIPDKLTLKELDEYLNNIDNKR